MDLSNRRIILYRLINTIPRSILIDCPGRYGAATESWKIGGFDTRIAIRVLTKCSMSWKSTVPPQKNEAVFHVNAEHPIDYGRYCQSKPNWRERSVNRILADWLDGVSLDG